MAEEAKQEKKGGKILATMVKVVLGLVFLALGVLAVIRWWHLIVLALKACVGPFLLLAGLITLAIAKE